MRKVLYISVAVLVSLAAIAFSQAPQVASWWGRVTIDSANASSGTTVLADNGTGNLSTAVGSYASNLYLADVGCSNGTAIKLRVYDLSASNVTCLPGAKTELNLSVSTASNGFACNYAGSCSSGFCVDGYCCNSACTGGSEDCNVAGSLGTCTSTAVSGSSGSGGGGGGGGGGGAPSQASESQSVSGTTSAGGSVDLKFAKSDTLAVESVKITVTESVQSVSVTVKETSKPSSAGVAISSSEGSVYKYLDITPTISNTKISSATVQFKIPKAWFDNNGIDPDTVVLKKNVGASWTDLPTQKTKFDGKNYFYEATTASFSVYAITGQKQKAPEQPGTPAARPAPSFFIISPSDGATVGADFTVELSVSNLDIVPPSDAVKPNEGHFHFFLDSGNYIPVVGTSYTFEKLSVGQHKIRVEMHMNDHSQFDPPKAQEIKVTVSAEAPAPPPGAAPNLTFVYLIVVLIIILAGGYWYFTRKR